MDSKKRPHDDDDTTATKKRILTGPYGSPLVNGNVTEQDEPDDVNNLEQFRKEAIYRRMKHYSREHERGQSRIAELERRKNTCEAGLAAISACWSQLVETIQLLMKPDDLPQVSVSAQDIFDLTAHVTEKTPPELAEALGEKANATTSLVTKFVRLDPNSQTQYVECQRVQTECAALRSELDVVHKRLEDCQSQRDNFHSQLQVAENRLDRARSKTVQAVEARIGTEKHDKKEEETEEPRRKPSSPAPSPASPPQSNGLHDANELENMAEMVRLREKKVVQLENEAAVLRDQKTILELQLKQPTMDQITENVHYKILLTHASMLDGHLEENRANFTKLSEELRLLQATRQEWEESVTTAAAQANSELKAMLTKRDVENARLREQREQLTAELNERKHKDAVKFTSLQELKSLAEGRSDRIIALESEIRRYKAQLAANAGAEDLMNFFLDGNTENAEYIQNLEARKTRAEERVAVLETALGVYQDERADVAVHMQAEVTALQKLAEATRELEQFRKVYGDTSSLSADVKYLTEQLTLKQTENKKLLLSEEQHKEAEKSLFAELDKLSSAWEALDRQLKNKVFDLVGMEERLTKSGLDRAKSENKYYAAMRDKEAIEAERKNLARNLEKQGKALDRMGDTERVLTNQVSTMEREVAMLKKLLDGIKDRCDHLDRENTELRTRIEGEKQRSADYFTVLSEREKQQTLKKADLRKIEDDLVRARKEAERRAAQLKESAMSSTTSRRDDSPDDDEMTNMRQLLKCSTCNQNFRSTVILKCMHTFCKACVDSRIAERRRKCPACGLAFAASDVQTLFFQ